MYLGFYANIWCHQGMLKIVFIIHRTMSHTCSTCQKTFRHRQTMISHMTTHTKELNFLCPICKRTFSQRCSRDRHVKNKSCNFDLKSIRNTN